MNFNLPFNGDSFIANNFLKFKNKFNIENVIETGTFEGGTTIFLAKNFKNVFSIECNEESFKKAENNIKNCNANVNLILGKSEEVLFSILNNVGDNTMFYLDAHWYDHCPLKNELQLIKKFNLKPIITIHDFFVPGSKKTNTERKKNKLEHFVSTKVKDKKKK